MSEEEAIQLKDRGNREFKDLNFASAIALYTHALEISKTNTLQLQLLSNTALCQLKLNQYQGALESCDNGLKIAPSAASMRVKLWFRRALALEGLGRVDEAVYQFERICAHPDIDENNKRLARSEISRIASETTEARQGVSPIPPARVAAQIDLNAAPTRPGMMAASHDIHVTDDVSTQIAALMREAMNNGGRMTAAQQARFNALTSGARVEQVETECADVVSAPPTAATAIPVMSASKCASSTSGHGSVDAAQIEEIVDEESEHASVASPKDSKSVCSVAVPLPAAHCAPDAAVPVAADGQTGLSGGSQPTLRGVWAAGGGKSLSAMLTAASAEPVHIPLPPSLRVASQEQAATMAASDAAVDRAAIARAYAALPAGYAYTWDTQDGAKAPPPAAQAHVAALVVCCREGRVLMVDRGAAEPHQGVEGESEAPSAAAFAGRTWYLPEAVAAPTESIAAAAERAVSECVAAGAPVFTARVLGAVCVEDYPALQRPLWLRVVMAARADALAGVPDTVAFAERAVDGNYAWVPIELVRFHSDLQLASTDLMNVTDSTPHFFENMQALAQGFPRGLVAAPLAPPQYHPEHVLDAFVVSAPATRPADVHVLLTEHADGRLGPLTTHVERGETFIFAASRVAKARCGLVLKDWALVLLAGGVAQGEASDTTNAVATPRGMRMSVATVTTGRVEEKGEECEITASQTWLSADGLELWPVQDLADGPCVPVHQWVDANELSRLEQAGRLRVGVLSPAMLALQRAQASACGEPVDSLLGLPFFVTIDGMVAKNEADAAQQRS